jgi:hypothetical protein
MKRNAQLTFLFGLCLVPLRAVFVLACLAVSGMAEQPMRDNTEQFLREHNISATEEAVTAALWNSDPAVRRAASHVLSSRWPQNAAAPIQEAMLQEDDGVIRVSLASDLAQLGEKPGREMLLTECHSRSEWDSTRVLAARSMFDLRDDSCVDAVLEILRSDSDPQDTLAKVDALNLVPSFIHHSTAQEYQAVMDLTVNSLTDPDAGVRLTASITLGRLEDSSAVATLQAAVASEQDPNIHSAMLGELKRLQDLQQSDRDPFRITIKTSTEQVVAGTQVDLEINVLNTSAEAMVASSGFQAYDGDTTYEYSCHDSSGNSVSKEILTIGSVHDPPSIEPGEAYTSTVFLNRVCDLNRPGRYEIQLSRGVPMGRSDFVVRSNKITITVIP